MTNKEKTYKELATDLVDEKIANGDTNAIMSAVENAKDCLRNGYDFWEILYASLEQYQDESDDDFVIIGREHLQQLYRTRSKERMSLAAAKNLLWGRELNNNTEI